jgi:hypothetical protein
MSPFLLVTLEKKWFREKILYVRCWIHFFLICCCNIVNVHVVIHTIFIKGIILRFGESKYFILI